MSEVCAANRQRACGADQGVPSKASPSASKPPTVSTHAVGRGGRSGARQTRTQRLNLNENRSLVFSFILYIRAVLLFSFGPSASQLWQSWATLRRGQRTLPSAPSTHVQHVHAHVHVTCCACACTTCTCYMYMCMYMHMYMSRVDSGQPNVTQMSQASGWTAAAMSTALAGATIASLRLNCTNDQAGPQRLHAFPRDTVRLHAMTHAMCP